MIELDHFNIDLDKSNKKQVKEIYKNLEKVLDDILEIKVLRNICRYKHYHIEVETTFNHDLKDILLYRLIFGDHYERIKNDALRFLKKEYETFGYMGDRKYKVTFSNGEKRKIGDYREIKI